MHQWMHNVDLFRDLLPIIKFIIKEIFEVHITEYNYKSIVF